MLSRRRTAERRSKTTRRSEWMDLSEAEERSIAARPDAGPAFRPSRKVREGESRTGRRHLHMTHRIHCKLMPCSAWRSIHDGPNA